MAYRGGVGSVRRHGGEQGNREELFRGCRSLMANRHLQPFIPAPVTRAPPHPQIPWAPPFCAAIPLPLSAPQLRQGETPIEILKWQKTKQYSAA